MNFSKKEDKAKAVERLKKLNQRIETLVKAEKERLHREKTFLRSVLNNTGAQASTEESEKEDLSEVFSVIQDFIDLQAGTASTDVQQPDKE